MRARAWHLLRGERRVAWVYREPDTSAFRYRVVNVIAAMEAIDDTVHGAWFDAEELTELTRIVHMLDAVVITRFPYTAALGRLIDRARQHDVKLVFDCDDLVFDPAFAPAIMDSLEPGNDNPDDWNYWFAYLGRIHATMSECEEGTTTNELLATKMAPYFPDQRVHVIPNVLHRAQESFSRVLVEAKRERGWVGTAPLTIGYFSGTPTHQRDFAVAAPAIARLLKREPDVRLRIAGYLREVADVLGPFRERIDLVPFMDFVPLQRSIAEVDLNVAPLQHNVFNNCKSDLKFFEAAAVGTWTVAARTTAYISSIADGLTSALAGEHEWDTALAEALDLVRDPDRHAERAGAAADAAYATYGWDSIGVAVRAAVLPARASTPTGV